MKTLTTFLLIFSISNANELETYLNNLKQEIQKNDASFNAFDYKRGEKIFTSSHIGKKGKEISCVSCHTVNLQDNGKNFFTNKEIKPLSPKANPQRLTEIKEIEKWLRRNFNDVYNREGTALEKGDVITYIMNK